MSKAVAYILLLFGPLLVSAQADGDTIDSGIITVESDNITVLADTSAVTRKVFTETVYKDTLTYVQREFANGFQEKYQGKDFQYKVKPKVKSKWDLFLEWLSNKIDEIFSFGDADKAASAATIIVRILALLILLFVVYLIVRALLNKEGMWIFGRGRKNINVNDITEKDIHAMNFRELIDDTKTSGDYRLAVRYYYLWVLKKLSVSGIINWHWDKTNSDYLYEIKDHVLRKDFEYLSYVYDYSWYGDFPIDDIAFAKAEKAFRKTISKL